MSRGSREVIRVRESEKARELPRRRRGAVGAMVLAGGFALLLAACSSSTPSSSSTTTTRPKTTVTQSVDILRVGHTSLGDVLIDSQGHTLYLHLGDSTGQSACTGSCSKSWLPLEYSGNPATMPVGPGVAVSKIGSLTRASGKHQIMYNGHPLYSYVGDHAAGQVNGEGLRTAFYVASPTGGGIWPGGKLAFPPAGASYGWHPPAQSSAPPTGTASTGAPATPSHSGTASSNG
jgi:predicted lipoprotein with Yx(FWY)xxD motif